MRGKRIDGSHSIVGVTHIVVSAMPAESTRASPKRFETRPVTAT